MRPPIVLLTHFLMSCDHQLLSPGGAPVLKTAALIVSAITLATLTVFTQWRWSTRPTAERGR